jgi:hypothetical protein
VSSYIEGERPVNGTITLTVAPALNSDGTRAYSGRGQLFNGMIDGREIVSRSTQPLLDGARVLLAEGLDPATRIVMRHAGAAVDALRSTVGATALVSVREGERVPQFTPWKPSPHAAVTPPMRQTELAATEAAE